MPVRPTTDFAKEGIFNLIHHRFPPEGKNILDLFCGTGNISLEFISREAKSVTAVDIHQANLRFIQETCQKINIDSIHVIKADVIRFLQKSNQSYDLIFADPPYDFNVLDDLPELILHGNHLVNGGIFILEHGKEKDFSTKAWFLERRTYGNVNFSIFIKK